MNEYLFLERFEKYLEKKGYSKFTPSGSPSTAYDYSQVRIPFILRNEQIDITELMLNIDYYVSIYDLEGAKEFLGNKSHRSVINALKRFREYCNSELFRK